MNLRQGLWCAILPLLLLCAAPATASSEKDKQKIFTGKIVAMDKASSSLIINGKIGSKSFSVDRRLLKGIKVGDKVKVTYTEKKGSQGIIKKIDRVKPTTGGEAGPGKAARPSRDGAIP